MRVNAWAAREPRAELVPFAYELAPLGDLDCLIGVHSCGICHSDLHMIDDDWRASGYPLVPGHEVIGEVLELGRAVQHLRVGDRVGVGWQRAACMSCPSCLGGNENLCDENRALIVGGHGGFADHVLVDARFAFPIPRGLDARSAGPLLCGGATVFSALHHAGMRSGQEIGVIGLGGLGHLAVQFASKLGNRVIAFTTSADKAELAARLGAQRTEVVAPGAAPTGPRRALDILISTVPHAQDWAAYLELLAPDGTLTFVAVPPPGSITVPLGALLSKRRRVMASPIGGRAIIARMLALAERHAIAPLCERFPLARVNEALAWVRANRVRFRAVLDVEPRG